MPRRRRVPSLARRARRLFRGGRIGHTRKGVAEMVGDSFLGVRLMKAVVRIKRADRNIARVKSANGEPGRGPGVLNHWPLPLRHGMHEQGLPLGINVRDMTLEEFEAMEGPLGVHGHTLAADCEALGTGRKIHPIWEPKSEDCNDLAFWQHYVDVAHSYGLVPWGWALPKYHHILPVMKKAGVARVIKLKG
jgi:hypothetical protein